MTNKTTSLREQFTLFFLVLFYTLFAWHQWWSGVSPRLIRGSAEREAIHHAHLSIGSTLFVILIVLAILWLIRGGASPMQKLRKAFDSAASTAISVFFLATFIAILCGLGQAWAKDEHTKFLGIFELPHFLNWSWSTSGYLHSSFSSISSAFFAGILFVFLFVQLKKYVAPGIAVGLLILLHLLVNLPKPPSLHPIAAIGTYIMVPGYYFIGLAVYTWANERRWIYLPVYALVALFFLYLPYFAFKVLPPWHQTERDEVVKVESKETLTPLRKASDIFPNEAALAEAKAAASWCTQCHNMKPSETHILGPNLIGIFNQQAGTVANYGRSSEAMINAGLSGIFWTRENLSKFLTNGQDFIPNNLMNQQTDLSDPEKLNQVIDLLEYISATNQE